VAAPGSELDVGRAELERLLPNQTSLTKQIVADGQVTQQEQEEAIETLFACFAEAGVTPSDPTWDGTRYSWTVSLNTLDPPLAQERSNQMFACEQQHWDYLSSMLTLVNAPTSEAEARLEQAMAECLEASGLDPQAYFELDPSVVDAEEAATCFRAVYGG
jgi:hypothetical protein